MQLTRRNIVRNVRGFTGYRRVILGLLLTVLGVFSPRGAFAQTDVRLIRPDVMILLDSSGSMEWRIDSTDSMCTGVDGGVCDVCSNGAQICSVSCPAIESHNRWTTAVEVLTGSIVNFTCIQTNRTDPTQYDYLYPIPFHQPLSNGFPLNVLGAVQNNDGILDTYSDRVRFGLMTFDNDLRTGLFANDGMFSYAYDQIYRPNGCPTSTSVNVGARRASTDNNVLDIVPGGLISVGSPNADADAQLLVNLSIRQSLVGRPLAGVIPAVPGLRPYGGTPIAGLLSDSYYYWTTNTDVTTGSASSTIGDPYFNCRTRANILITDGGPNMDLRPGCVGGICPYATPDQTALMLSMTGSGAPAVKTFVIAFNSLDPAVAATLTPIAIAGGTMQVYYASDRVTLASALATVLNTVSSFTSTRTPPVFGQQVAGVTSVGATQYQFASSFTIQMGLPWSGVLTRNRTVCQSPGGSAAPVPTTLPVDTTAYDDFALDLRAGNRAAAGWGTRYLWTYLPSGATLPAQLTVPIAYATTSGVGSQTELTSTIPAALFNYTMGTDVVTLLAWLRGDSGSLRQYVPLGDIYHSVPVAVGPPTISLPDQSFTAYRQLPLPVVGRRTVARTIATREPMLYVGTNDGILHGFNQDTGQEVWGFVPPYLIPSLKNQYPNVRQFGVDGPVVAKEVVFERSPSAPALATSWHSVVVAGLREGGGAYVALDVTDPYNPIFLWQFADRDLTNAYGAPAIGTLYYNPPEGGAPVERAVAFLPGGAGLPATLCSPTANPRPPRPTSPSLTGWTGGRGARRPYVRCWQGTSGQYFYVVELATGRLLRKIGAGPSGTLPTGSPIVGQPTLYNGQAGAVATRAYVGDSDGTLWRIDFSSRLPIAWKMEDIWDLFWDRAYDIDQPLLERPAITVDNLGNTQLSFGSGDNDLLEDIQENRIASIHENTSMDATGAVTGINIDANWEVRVGSSTATQDLWPGERLTGPMTLFNNILYFGTFIPRTTGSPCNDGFARLWGVDMVQTDPSAVGTFVPMPRLDVDGIPADDVRVTCDLNNNGTCADDVNSILFGTTVAQQPNCNVTSSTIDPTTGFSRSFVQSSSGGSFALYLQTGHTQTLGTTTSTITSRPIARPIVPARVDAWATVFE